MSIFKNIFGDSEKGNSSQHLNWINLTQLEQLDGITESSSTKPILIFKHSTRCAISKMALRSFEREFNLQDKITPYFLDLLEHRDISNEIAQRFNVVHQSPQIVLIHNQECIYDASHEDIHAQKLNSFIGN